MPTHDEEFIRRLRATFQVEADEHLQAIVSGLLAIEKASSPLERQGLIEKIYREVHSLKGAARAVDLPDIESICQAAESLFAKWKQEAVAPAAEALDTLHKVVDLVRALLSATSSGTAETRQARDSILSRLGQLEFSGVADVTTPSQAPRVTAAAGSVSPAAEPERATTETVRISTEKLDAQLLRVEDLLPFKSIMAQRARELQELHGQMERWQKQWTKVSAEARSVTPSPTAVDAGAPSHGITRELADFYEWNVDFHRSLEQRLRSLTTQIERDQHHVAKRLDELAEDSKKLLMLPFGTVAAALPKIIRDLSRQQGKEAELVLHGTDVEVDKRILEEMKDALVHMVRNSVDHGIEAPAERSRKGKRAQGTIIIAVSQVNGSKVEIRVSDDGAGINVEEVKQAAVSRNLLSAQDAQAMAEADALSLIFRADISTSKSVTTVSGRGLGMAIVRSKVEGLGGHVEIESSSGMGTMLRMVLPLTLATFRGVLVSVAEQVFVIPTANVERALRIKPADIRTVENRETLAIPEEGGRVISLARLAAVLQLPPPSRAPDAGATVPVLVLRAAGERIGFIVDEVLREEEVLVKPLRKPLMRVRNIGGATILGNGRAVPALNVNDLMKSARSYGAVPAPAVSSKPAESAAKRVLVVEDSITSRMLLKGILESAGYVVQVAVDGMEAFARLREAPFDLVVSDVEMPRLNGFDLTARIRADKRLADLPVVLVTALESRAQRERGLEAGANAYIVKSSFDQNHLLEAVRRLL